MKKAIWLAAALLLTGCRADLNRVEINDVDFVRVMGIDKEDGYTVSLLLEEENNTVSGEGSTIFEAYETAAKKCVKQVTLAHTKYFLTGRGVLNGGMRECVDFITRDRKVKTDVSVYAAESARELIGAENLAESLDYISRRSLFGAYKQPNTLTDIYNTNISELLPLLVFDDILEAKGYAVTNNMKSAVFADEKTSIGLNFISGRTGSGGIFTDIGGTEIYNCKTRLADKDKIYIDVYFETNIREAKEAVSRDYIGRLTKAQNEYVSGIISVATEYLRETNISYMNIDWNKETEIKVHSKINGTFDIE